MLIFSVRDLCGGSNTLNYNHYVQKQSVQQVLYVVNAMDFWVFFFSEGSFRNWYVLGATRLLATCALRLLAQLTSMWIDPHEPLEYQVKSIYYWWINRCSTIPQLDRWRESGIPIYHSAGYIGLIIVRYPHLSALGKPSFSFQTKAWCTLTGG